MYATLENKAVESQHEGFKVVEIKVEDVGFGNVWGTIWINVYFDENLDCGVIPFDIIDSEWLDENDNYVNYKMSDNLYNKIAQHIQLNEGTLLQ